MKTPAKLLVQDPCPFGQPIVLTVARMDSDGSLKVDSTRVLQAGLYYRYVDVLQTVHVPTGASGLQAWDLLARRATSHVET